jgi:N-acetylglucosamine-6-phosphate deacetylase
MCGDNPTMNELLFTNGRVILEDRLLDDGQVVVKERIVSVHSGRKRVVAGAGAKIVDLQGGYLAPGFVDLHVHGGDGADFMDATEQAFRTVCAAHLRHGTTSLLPTTTAARHDQFLAFLDTCGRVQDAGGNGARVLGAHFYGPYFAPEARGCHPEGPVRAPTPAEFDQYLAFSHRIRRATVAPELSGAEEFALACRARGIGCNAGHSHATFGQMERARSWGISHVDHLFCAMSDRARLRQAQAYPMRGGVLEATLYFDDLTTEVIADGKHLERELLLLAYKIKGPERLALVTDCNRALDQPDGTYIFGPMDGGEPIVRRDGVGIMPDGKSLASGVVGMDECVRTFHRLTGIPLLEVVRMASATPARIAGWSSEIGSIAPAKRGDLLVLGDDLSVRQVYVEGRLVIDRENGATDASR